jgi:hypothetical protein
MLFFSFANSEEYLYLEYGYTWGNEFNVKGVDTIVDNNNRIWYRPNDKEQAKSILDYDFIINCIILLKINDITSCKYKLRVIENLESIELMVTEYVEGDFEKLSQTVLTPFLNQGVIIHIDK